jgi:hypothetical protein
MKPRKSRPLKRRPVKPVVSDKVWNIHHPELFDKVEESFKAGGVQYYTFKKDTTIRYGRYLILQAFLQEVNFRMSTDTLKAYIAKITEELNGSKGTVNLGNALEYLGHMKNLTELAFEPDTVYRLASCLFFDDTEDLRTWDKTHNETKIRAWRALGTLDFFYDRLFQELTGLKNISETAITDYLEKVGDLKKKYDSAIQSQ